MEEFAHNRKPQENPPAWVGKSVEPFDLVLEGGSMRGMFTAGVTDYFLERGLLAQHVIGTSAGALCGYNYVAGQTGRTIYLNAKYCADWRYLSMKNFARTGSALGIEFVFDEIPNKLEPFDYDTVTNSPMLFTSVSSNLDLGEADYHTFSDGKTDVPYLISSASLPIVSKIVEVDGKHLLDGGVCDSVPYLFSMMCGTKKQVIVLTQDANYVKKPNKLMSLASRMYADYPYFVERMNYRHYEYNLTYRRIARLEQAGEVFVIRPPKPVTVGSMESDASKLLDLYEQGYTQAQLQFNDLLRYLEL